MRAHHALRKVSRCGRFIVVLIGWLAVGQIGVAGKDDRPFEALPLTQWKGPLRYVVGSEEKQLAAVGFPGKQASTLVLTSGKDYPPGQYRLRLKLSASHIQDEIAWQGELVVTANEQTVARLPAIDFGRLHEPEWRTIDFVQQVRGPLKLELTAEIDAKVFEKAAVARELGAKDAKLNEIKTPTKAADDDDILAELTVALNPTNSFYFLLDQAEIAPLSQSVIVSSVAVDKVRYAPGEKLKGSAVLQLTSGAAKGASWKGTLNLYLEKDLASRVKAKEIPVVLDQKSQSIDFELDLPREELGYALVAEFSAEQGLDRSAAAEYFTILENFQRMSIWGSLGTGHGGTFRSAAEMQQSCRELRANYLNAVEQFAWAEEDMVEMSPDAEVWYSGQTCYRLQKKGLKQLIAAAHAQGIAMTSYGKFIMSGYLGWNTAWNYPQDHQRQFYFPVGLWNGCNAQLLDRFRFKEFVPYDHGVTTDGMLVPFWQAFLPINPDPTPRMTRIAAEETLRSIEMFDWDGIRWDGQMRGDHACGGAGGDFSFAEARKTETLVRYYKDIVAAKSPHFRHGYNYLFVQETPNYDWAYDDFELDELSRDGGLLMNESIGNTTEGREFGWLAKNIQVEGDLARERGGFLLGISYADTPRDQLVESILYFAGGCRPMGGTTLIPLINRYGTRFANYTFDETLRRLDRPEEVLQPNAETELWWQSFVYETRRAEGKSQLVVNLINIPREAVTRGGKKDRPIDWKMPTGSTATDFRLKLPKEYRATAAHLIDPFTLAVTPLDLQQSQVSAPPVDTWRVLIVDLEAPAKAATLAERFGPPKTFQVPRPGLKDKRFDAVTLDVQAPLATVDQQMLTAFGAGHNPFVESTELAKMSPEERNKALLARKALPENSAEAHLKNGALLPADGKLKAQPAQQVNTAPRRDGVADIFIARGPMDHRLRWEATLGELPACRPRNATLSGARTDYGLHNNIGPADLPRFDLVVYCDTPHGAIGPEMSYALVDYVKAGGGVLFTGGQFSFGKGGYDWTVLDRELLPVQIVENIDARISTEPLTLEAGPDFDTLGVKVNWQERPSLLVFNETALIPDTKVFLKAGNRPILVGRQLERGRVVCLLASPMGQSTETAKLFCEWTDWPRLMAAVLKWASPEATQIDKDNPPPPEKVAAVIAACRREKSAGALDDLLDAPEEAPAKSEFAADDLADKGAAKELDAETLAKRLAQIEILLAAPSADGLQILAEQVTTIPNLPEPVFWRILDALSAAKPSATDSKALAKVAMPAFKSSDLRLHRSGLILLAIAADAEFAHYLRAGIASSEVELLEKTRALALALPYYRRADLVDVGQVQISKWSETEARQLKAYTGGSEFTLAAPARPLIDNESLALRIGWLAYLAGQVPERFARPFAQEWAMLGQYLEYCDTTEAGLWEKTKNSTATQRGMVRTEVQQLHRYRTLLVQLKAQTHARIVALLKDRPVEVASGFAGVRFQLAAWTALQSLAETSAWQTPETIEVLSAAPVNRVLKEFISSRQSGPTSETKSVKSD